MTLIESPVFIHLRLQLLEPNVSSHRHLLKALYGLLMLLPQSSTAFRTLRDRLTSVSSLHIALGQLTRASGTDSLPASATSASLRTGVKGALSGKANAAPSIEYGPLLAQFTEVQVQCTAAKRAEMRGGKLRAGSAAGAEGRAKSPPSAPASGGN